MLQPHIASFAAMHHYGRISADHIRASGHCGCIAMVAILFRRLL
jgi:hypothetical protein